MKDNENNIDNLLAELRSDKHSSDNLQKENIEDILASLGKNSLYVKKQTNVNEQAAAPKGGTLFDEIDTTAEFLKQAQPAIKPEPIATPEPAAKASNAKTASFFADEMFASTFANQQAPTTKKQEKENRKKQEEQEYQAEQEYQEQPSYSQEEIATARTIIKRNIKKSEPPVKQADSEAIIAEPIQKVDEPLPQETPNEQPRKIEAQAQAGTLRKRILNAAKQNLYTTEEDEEYIIKPKVFAAYAQEATSSQEENHKNVPENEDKKIDEPTQEIILPLKNLATPTVEFLAQDGVKIHERASSPIVISPDGVRENVKAEKAVPTLKSEVDEKFREFFGETVAVSREEIEKGLNGEKAGKILRKFFGARDEYTGELTQELTSELTAEIDNFNEDENDNQDDDDDYNSPSDAPVIEETLRTMRATASMRVCATLLTSLLLIYLGISARTGLLPAIKVLDPLNEPLFYLVANFALLLITGIVCLNSIISGITGFFKEANEDTLTLVGFTGALIQNIAFLISPDQFDPMKTTLFAPVAALLICASAWGKRVQCATVCKNFETVSAGYDHWASYILKNRELTVKVCNGLVQPEPALLISRPTALVKNFLSQSFSQSKCAKTSKIMSLVILVSGIICAIYAYVQSDSIYTAISAFAALCALCAPLAATMVSAIPASLLQASSAKVCAVVPGWGAIEQLGTTNAVLVNAKDLFPPDTVRLHGIKTFEKERIDLAILYAASVLVEGCETLRDIFLNVIENKTEMLYKVESLTNEPGYGFSAWIEHTRVIVGNRAMMMRHDIDVPSLDYEMKYTKGERSPIYLSVSGKLFGMFLVSYQTDNEADNVLYGLAQSGISVVVKSDDFNLTSALICSLYGLNESMVKVLTAQERDALHPQTSYLPESEGVLTHLGTFSSFVGGLRAAAGAASGIKMAMLVQCVAIIVGLLLCGLLVINSGLTGISLTAVLLYQIAWSVLTMLIPLGKRS